MANEKKLDCVILGLLAHEDLTGYEIKKRMDTALRFFWGASFGSIYPTLKGLVEDGLAVKADIAGGRNKITYSITDAGRIYLKNWLEVPVEKDELRYETLSTEERVAVFSEIYYDKGWKAYIDGEEVSYFRADYVLRAMVVPPGAHTIEWKFRAPRFALVEGITLACSIVILLWLAAAMVFRMKNEKLKMKN